MDSNDKAVSMDILPLEILEHVLQYLPKKDLLSGRQVNSNWKSICTRHCRRQFVSLNEKGLQQLSKCHPDTTPIDNMPWSSCHLNVYDHRHVLDNFTRWFGPCVLHLNITCSQVTQKVVASLHQMPNLQKLEIIPVAHCFLVSQSSSTTATPSESKLSLPKLKHLNMSLTSASIDGMELILKTQDLNLEYANISIAAGMDDMTTLNSPQFDTNQLVRISGLLAKIPKLEIGIEYSLNEYRPILNSLRNLHVKKFDASILGVGNRVGSFYHPLEAFLDSCSNHLEHLELSLDNHLSFEPSSSTLKLPTLPNLASMELSFYKPTEGFESFEIEHIDYDFLSPLESNRFPKLQKISMRNNAPTSMIGAFENCQFESVVEVVLHGYHPGDQWGTIFPNVRKLKATPKDRDEDDRRDDEDEEYEDEDENPNQVLFNLLQNMPNLVELELVLESCVGTMVNTQVFESLLPLKAMKNLSCLKLFMDSVENSFGDGAAYQTLLLPPLDLFLRNVKISEECEMKLRGYHREVTIYTAIWF